MKGLLFALCCFTAVMLLPGMAQNAVAESTPQTQTSIGHGPLHDDPDASYARPVPTHFDEGNTTNAGSDPNYMRPMAGGPESAISTDGDGDDEYLFTLIMAWIVFVPLW